MLPFKEKGRILERDRVARENLEKRQHRTGDQETTMSSLERQLMEETGKPIMFVDLGPKEGQLKSIRELRAISYPSPERAVRALKRMWDYKSYLESLSCDPRQCS